MKWIMQNTVLLHMPSFFNFDCIIYKPIDILQVEFFYIAVIR